MVLARAARDRTFIAISHSSELWSNVIAADTVCKLPQCECVTISHAACAVERPVRWATNERMANCCVDAFTDSSMTALMFAGQGAA